VAGSVKVLSLRVRQPEVLAALRVKGSNGKKRGFEKRVNLLNALVHKVSRREKREGNSKDSQGDEYEIEGSMILNARFWIDSIILLRDTGRAKCQTRQEYSSIGLMRVI
jgi:hypothetical protein